MKAIILAAGKGTRLKNLTANKPKALVEVNGAPMLETVINKISKAGISDIIINIHHHGKMITDFLEQNNYFGLNIQISDETDMLLDTGGAILKMKYFIHGSDSILVHNVDIISDLNISDLSKHHHESGSIASLCTRERTTNRGLLFNNYDELIGWTNSATDEIKWVKNPAKDFHKRAFNGIYMISPEFVDKIKLTGRFSIIDVWLDIAKKEKITCFHDESNFWHDLGTKEKITKAESH